MHERAQPQNGPDAPARWHAAQQGQAVCLCAPLRQSVGPVDGKQARQEGRRHHQEHQHRREQQLAPQHAPVRPGRRLQNGNARLLLHGKHGGQRDRQEEEQLRKVQQVLLHTKVA